MLKMLIAAGLIAASLMVSVESQDYVVTGEFHDVRGITYHEARATDGTRLLFLDENLANGKTVKVGDKVTALYDMMTPDDEGELIHVIKK